MSEKPSEPDPSVVPEILPEENPPKGQVPRPVEENLGDNRRKLERGPAQCVAQ